MRKFAALTAALLLAVSPVLAGGYTGPPPSILLGQANTWSQPQTMGGGVVGNVTGNVSGTAGSVAASGITGGPISTANTPAGKSVADPGTGKLEELLPPQTLTAASYTFATADLQLESRRSNSGSAMTDTFPASGASGMANGTRITVNNVDTTANDTITAGSGTTFSGSSTDVIEPGRSVTYLYDLANTTWRKTLNTGSAGIFGTTSGNTIGDIVTMRSTRAGVQDSGKAIPTGAVVGTTDTQTLTNKTISGGTVNATALTTNGGSGVSYSWRSGTAGMPVVPIVAPANTSENTLVDITIPANTLGANSCFRFLFMITMTGSTNAKTFKEYFSTTGGTMFWTGVASGATLIADTDQIGRWVCNVGATNSQLMPPLSPFGGGGAAVPILTGSSDTTAATHFVFTGQKALAGENITINWYELEIRP